MGRGTAFAQRDEGEALNSSSGGEETVMAGGGRPPRLSPAYPHFMSPCVGTGALSAGPLSPALRATPPG